MTTHHLSSDDIAFVRRFETGTLPAGSFHHREHVRLAYCYLVLAAPDEACSRFRAALHGFIARHGVNPAKYHETLTRAWVLAVAHFMAASAGAPDFASFIAANGRLLTRDLLLLHYSPAVLGSDEARATFVEPDLAPIP
ncbi:MAG TPA: hypothetical protein VIC33_05500 [Vicinamibacterales bacterium]|jgi:hypothetical protein